MYMHTIICTYTVLTRCQAYLAFKRTHSVRCIACCCVTILCTLTFCRVANGSCNPLLRCCSLLFVLLSAYLLYVEIKKYTLNNMLILCSVIICVAEGITLVHWFMHMKLIILLETLGASEPIPAFVKVINCKSECCDSDFFFIHVYIYTWYPGVHVQ